MSHKVLILVKKVFTTYVSNVIAKASARHSVVSRCPRVVSRCPPARAIVRAVTVTKHELGLSPFFRVVSYGSAAESRALPVRLLSHHQRAVFHCAPQGIHRRFKLLQS